MKTRSRRLAASVATISVLAGLMVAAVPAPASAVTLDGVNNFAGPADQCPSGWECTTDTSDVVMTSDGGENRAVCTGPCTVSMTNTSGPNNATCTQSSTTSGETQTCDITQVNDTGSNSITATQTAALTADSILTGVAQAFAQAVKADQQNGSGDNVLTGAQSIAETATTAIAAVLSHDQEGTQSVDADSTTVDGDITINVSQNLAFDSDAAGLLVTQNQNTANGGPNQDVNVVARSQSGVVDIVSGQDQDLDQNATGLVGTPLLQAAQTQGSDTGGAQLTWDADSNNTCSVTDHQDKDWSQDANTVQKTQNQLDRLGIAGLPFTCHQDSSHQTTTLHNDGFRLCRQVQDVHVKLPAGVDPEDTQNCNDEVMQESSGTRVMTIGCDAQGEETFDSEGNPCTTKETTGGQPEVLGEQGCGPGFWKNNQDDWGPSGLDPAQTIEGVFDVPDEWEIDDLTLLDALSFSGGSTVPQNGDLLLHHATAAVLNALHPDVDYARLYSSIVSDANAAMASGNAGSMQSLKSAFEADNEGGCPLLEPAG